VSGEREPSCRNRMLRHRGLPMDTKCCGVMDDLGVPLHWEHFRTPVLWWGCMQPERAHDEGELWDLGCSKCQMRARLVYAIEGGDILCMNGRAGWSHATLAEVIDRLDELGEWPPADWIRPSEDEPPSALTATGPSTLKARRG
jgi:hypothetical protein